MTVALTERLPDRVREAFLSLRENEFAITTALRRGIAAGERRTADTDHDEIVRLMIGADSAAA